MLLRKQNPCIRKRSTLKTGKKQNKGISSAHGDLSIKTKLTGQSYDSEHKNKN